jgi:hypothetical protein
MCVGQHPFKSTSISSHAYRSWWCPVHTSAIPSQIWNSGDHPVFHQRCCGFKEEKKYKLLIQSRKLIFEPIIGCKHLIITSGATPIRSAGRAPDRKIHKVKIFYAGWILWVKLKKLWAYTRINIIWLWPWGYSHWECWSCNRWFKNSTTMEE